MVGRDTHNALKTEVVNKDNAGGVEFVTVKLYWGKDDIAFSLHAAPGKLDGSGKSSAWVGPSYHVEI